MKGIDHEILLERILPFACFFLGYTHIDFIDSLVFIILWWIGTYYITCDWDTNSRSTKKAGLIGWIFNKCFKHRGTLHSPVFWGITGIICYAGFGWICLGLIIPQFIHIISDCIT